MNKLFRFYAVFFILCTHFLGSIVWAGEVVLTNENLRSTFQKYSKHAEPEHLVLMARKKEEGYFYRSFLPSLEASYLREVFRPSGAQLSNSYGWNVQGRMSLFNGGRDLLEESVRENRTVVAAAEKKIKEQSIMQQIKKSFWSTIYSQSLIAAIEKALKDNDQILGFAEKRIRAGIASPVDRLDFKMNGIRLRQDLQRSKNELRSSENQLRALLMLPDSDQMKITQDLSDDHEILNEIEKGKSKIANNPEFSSIQAQSKIEYFQSRMNGRWYLPKLDFYSGIERPSIREDSRVNTGVSEWYAGLELKFSLGEVATSIMNAQSKDLEAQAKDQLKKNTYQLNEASMNSLVENIKSLHALFHDAEAIVKESEIYVSRILKEYDRGVKSSIDALNATRQSYDARREGLAILRDYKYSIIDYYNLIGEFGD